MQLRCLQVLFALALAAGGEAAAVADPMEAAPQCRNALDVLEARENALLGARAGGARPDAAALASLETLRRQATRACLGNPTQAAAAKPSPTPPTTTPAAAPAPRARRPATAASAVPTDPKPSRDALTILSCDADSCVASDGTRLVRTGTKLIGPRGICRGSPGQPLRCP